jgi:hypothetical protein
MDKWLSAFLDGSTVNWLVGWLINRIDVCLDFFDDLLELVDGDESASWIAARLDRQV